MDSGAEIKELQELEKQALAVYRKCMASTTNRYGTSAANNLCVGRDSQGLNQLSSTTPH